MLYAELESEEALKAYAPHPAHEEFKKLPEPYKTGASCRSRPALLLRGMLQVPEECH